MKRPLLLTALLLCVLVGLHAQTVRLQVIYGAYQGTAEEGVVVTFDQPMVALGPATERPDGPLKLQPPTPGKYRWLGTRTLAFYPERLVPATRYTATVPSGTRAANGASLERDHSFEFATERPRLEDFQGTVWSRDSSRTGKQRTYLHFNLPVSPERAAPFIQTEPKVKLKLRRGGDLPRWKAEQTLVVEPAGPLKGEHLTLKLLPGLLAAEGNLGLEEARNLGIKVPGALRFLKLEDSKWQDPGESLKFHFNNPVLSRELIKKVRLNPPARYLGTLSPGSAYEDVDINYELAPDTRYTVTLPADLRDEYGHKLGRTLTLPLRTAGLAPTSILPVGERTHEAYLAPRLPIGFLNVPKVRVRAARISRDNLVPLLRKVNDEKWLPRPAALDTTITAQARRNRITYRPLELQSLLDGGYGVVALRFDPAGGGILSYNSTYETVQRTGVVQVTRMGLTAKFSPLDITVWVTDLENGAGLAGTEIEVRDRNNKVCWKGKTDADGIAKAPGWQKLGLDQEADLYVLASRGKDLAFIHEETGNDVAYIPVERRYHEAAVSTALLFSDRGLYRPGDTVRLKGILRHLDWSVPKGKSLELTIKDSRGETFSQSKVTVSERGSFDATLKLPPQASTGQWDLELAGYGRSSFRVEAYKPAQFEVRVKPERKHLTHGQTLNAVIHAAYLFGAPMGKAPVRYTVITRPVEFTSPSYPDMQFGPDPWLHWRWSDGEEDGAEHLQGEVEGLTDTTGNLQVKVPLRPETVKGPSQVTLEASASAVDGSEVTGRCRVQLHPAGLYVGLKPKKYFLEDGSKVEVQAVVVRPDGQTVEGHPIELELLRREYRSVRRTSGVGSEWISVAKDVPVGKASGTQATFDTSGSGLYLLRGRARDEAGKVAESEAALYVYSQAGGIGWPQGDNRLELVPDKRSYKPGETIRLAISSPFPQARALVTVESDGVMERFVRDLKGGTPVVQIPVRDEYAPNVFASVALIQGRTGRDRYGANGEDLARPTFRMGIVKIPVAADGHRLKVDIKPDHDGYLPGETVNVELAVRDAQGKPRSAELTFVAADEGVLNLIDYHLPDPMLTFFKPRLLSVTTCETRWGVIGQRKFGEKGNPGGGGGDFSPFALEAGNFRWNFEATPCWQPALQTDGQGRARVSFKLPDSLTAFRLAAVAHDGSYFGRGEDRIQVRKPLSLTASWPRFCTLGDQAQAGVTVHNQTAAPGAANVTFQAEGGEPLSRTVQVAPGESQVVRFPVRADRAGHLRMRFAARLNGESDAVEAVIPVNLPRVINAAAARETVEDTPLDLALEVPAEAVPGSAKLDLTMSSSALVGLKPAVDYLKGYSYECLEQKTSRVYPIVAAADLLESFGTSKPEGRKLVQEVLDAIPGLRTSSGGLSLWPGGKPHPWATAYALNLCWEASQQYYKVPDMGKALGYLARLVNESDEADWGYPYSDDERLNTRAYVLMTLARYQQLDAAAANRLFEQRENLSVAGRSWLLRALKERPKDRAEMARLLLNRLKVENSAFFQDSSQNNYIYDSPIRSTALALQALLEAGVDFPQSAQVVRWLVDRRRDGRWRNTQENAAVFSALSTYYRKKEAVAPNFEASARLAGQEILRRSFQGRAVVSQETPLTGSAALQVQRTGTGTLHLSALLRYASPLPPAAEEAGISVVRMVEPVSPVAAPYPPGTLLRVRLLVTSPLPRTYVVVNDPIPAGLEIVNSQFATERSGLEAEQEEGNWWGGFNHTESYDDRMLLFADTLDPGLHRFKYYLRTAYPGTYAWPPCQAEEMYNPEVFGRTHGDTITIR